ncbi:MAG: PGPGW domain-containing protein [Mycobacteriaceae bacterium]
MKRAVVAVLGSLITLAGIALLVLPGPGFVLVAAGLAILSTQFDWAKKPLDYAKDKANQGVDEVRRSKWRAAFAASCGVVLAGVGVAGVAGVDVPFVNLLSAVLLIGSGLFLIGSTVWARTKSA